MNLKFPKLTYTEAPFREIHNKIAEELIECETAFSDEPMDRYVDEVFDLAQVAYTLLYKLQTYGVDMAKANERLINKLTERGVIVKEG